MATVESWQAEQADVHDEQQGDAEVGLQAFGVHDVRAVGDREHRRIWQVLPGQRRAPLGQLIKSRRARIAVDDKQQLADPQPFKGGARHGPRSGRRIAHHDQCRERQILAALDDLGHAVDVDDLVDHPAFRSLVVAAIVTRPALSSLHWTLHQFS